MTIMLFMLQKHFKKGPKGLFFKDFAITDKFQSILSTKFK